MFQFLCSESDAILVTLVWFWYNCFFGLLFFVEVMLLGYFEFDSAHNIFIIAIFFSLQPLSLLLIARINNCWEDDWKTTYKRQMWVGMPKGDILEGHTLMDKEVIIATQVIIYLPNRSMFYKLISDVAYNFSTKISIANLRCNQLEWWLSFNFNWWSLMVSYVTSFILLGLLSFRVVGTSDKEKQ